MKGKTLITYSFFQTLILGTARNIIGPLVPIISKELNIGLDLVGFAISIGIFILFLLSFTVSTLLERFGVKKVLYISMGFNFLGSFLLYFTHIFFVFIISYAMIEIGFGIMLISSISIADKFYLNTRASSLLKISLGKALACTIAPFVVTILLFIKINWRYYYVFNMGLIILLVIILHNMKIPPKIRVNNDYKSLLFISKKIIKSPNFIVSILIVFLFFSVTETFYIWFTSYFEGISININMSSIFLSFYGVALFLGVLIKNSLIKKWKGKKILLTSFIISFLLLVGILFIKNIIIKNVLIFLFGILVAGNGVIACSIGSEFFPKLINYISGLLIAFSYLGIVVFQYISGYFSEYYSKNSVLYINVLLSFILIPLAIIISYRKDYR